MKKRILAIVLILVVLGAGKYVYDRHINHNFKEISEGKVYKSGVIPPDEIEDYVKKYNIKSIIDLRFPGTADLENNPELPEELLAEKRAVEKIPGVNYYNLGTDQVPTQETIDRFLEVMDDSTNYPVVIHCHHGEGRAPLFAALYKIEYEGVSGDEARKDTRFLVKWSSFDDGKPKGEFLKNYKPRREK